MTHRWAIAMRNDTMQMQHGNVVDGNIQSKTLTSDGN